MNEMLLAQLTVDYATPIMAQVKRQLVGDKRLVGGMTAREEALIEALTLSMISAIMTLEAAKAGVLPGSLKPPGGRP